MVFMAHIFAEGRERRMEGVEEETHMPGCSCRPGSFVQNCLNMEQEFKQTAGDYF